MKKVLKNLIAVMVIFFAINVVEVKATDITSDSVPFNAENMFPGDKIVENFCVKVTYDEDITLQFDTDIHEGSEMLAEVLYVQVKVKEGEQVLYNGTMKEMPSSLDYELKATEKTTLDVHYEISVWLDTSVGNEYQNKKLTADFIWFVEGEEVEDMEVTPEQDDSTDYLPSTLTGDNTNMYFWIVAMGFAFYALVYLVLRHGRREKTNVQ